MYGTLSASASVSLRHFFNSSLHRPDFLVSIMTIVRTMMPHPAWVTARLEDTQRRSNVQTYICLAVLNILSLALMSVRIYVWAQHTMRTTLLGEILACLLSYCSSLATQLVLFVATIHGASGLHTRDLSLDEYNFFNKVGLLSGSCVSERG